jgi:hypothetical protein
MTRSSTTLLFLALTLLVSACTGRVSTPLAGTDTPEIRTSPSEPEISTTEVASEATVPAPTATQQSLSLTQYSIKAILDYAGHHLTVDEEINYSNNASVALEDLLLILEPNRAPGVFSLTSLNWQQDDQPVTDYSLDGAQLRIPLREPLNPGERANLAISYELNIPEAEEPFGYTERQTNLGDWYPYAPPYRPGEGWMVRDDAYLGEHLVYDVADFQVDIHLTDPVSPEGRSYTIAASAPAEEAGDWHHYQMDAARTFAWSVSDQYQVLTTTVGDVTVLGYSFPYHASADEPALQATADALNLYNDLFGPYSHKSLSVVEADFLNGMEYEGLFFLSHAFYDYFTGTPENNLIIIAAHETAHQWFYGWVGNDQAMEPWLDEALATFSESLFYEHEYPDRVDWWWENRVYFHKPEGWVDSTIYDTPGFYPYRDAVYLRGTLFLKDLEDLMGEAAFLGFLKDYLNQYRYKIASGDDFFALLKEHTSADISGLVAEYFSRR